VAALGQLLPKPLRLDGAEQLMKNTLSRRNFVRSGALVAAALAASKDVFASAAGRAPAGEGSAIQLGVASYTFRNFNRAQMIGFLKQLNVLALNAKDVKDHLPMEPQGEAAALADYGAAGIRFAREQMWFRRSARWARGCLTCT